MFSKPPTRGLPMIAAPAFPRPWPEWRKRLTAAGLILAFVALWFLPAILVLTIAFQSVLFYTLLVGQIGLLIGLGFAYRSIEFMYELSSDWTWKSSYLEQQLAHNHPLWIDVHQVDDDQRQKQRMSICSDGLVTIHRGFVWDGCTPKFSFFGVAILGTYDGDEVHQTAFPQLAGRKAAYYASLVHDAFYIHLSELAQYGITKAQADHVFYEILSGANFAHRGLYYRAVDVFGAIRKGMINRAQASAGASRSTVR